MIFSQRHYHRRTSLFKIILISICLFPYLAFQKSHAETEIYGSLKYDYQYSQPQIQRQTEPHHDDNTEKNDATSIQKRRSQSNIKHNDSHIGIKGQKELGNGNAIIYQLEWGDDQ
ncbi:MAG TPA: hypothetical protein H9889_07730 [Candidatus Ignatzschineria merdigallinarum]|uniref:Uncharacterized protein n=1 Tax=Candidatus Ignatzschineria merdigallinarum TaxID=2838621 RepID=A0A9D1Q7S5_9GAMM|nr:hypothetical protein [Candidatus Ignatzschineria merdigallinarum]